MLKVLSAAAALALIACSAMPTLAADPTVTPLPFTQGGTTYQECTYSDGSHFWVCHLAEGWDYTNNKPKAPSIDSSTGNANVQIQPSPAITTVNYTISAAGQQTAWTCFRDTKIVVAMSGDPTSIDVAHLPITYRAASAPTSGVETNYQDASGMSVAPLQPGLARLYEEPGEAWWSVLVPTGAFSSGSYSVSLSGKGC